MKASQLIAPTLKEAPADAEVPSHILLVRGGFIRRLATGSYNYLPLGLRVLKKIENIVREELDRAGAQEILMPVVQPANLWQESGRWDVMGPEMLRLKDRHERDYCLSPTQEEVVTDLVRRVIVSYKQLPLNLYHIQTKFRDEIRPRFGLMRSREFLMKDGYSFHLDEDSFEESYQAMFDAYSAMLEKIGLTYRAVDADPGNMGDGDSHEFHVLAEAGEDELAFSPTSDYAANVEKAVAPRIEDDHAVEEMATVDTPNAKTIDAVSKLLGVESRRCVKTLIVRGESEPVALVLRGDHELNEAKAGRLPGILRPLEFASDEEIIAAITVSPGSIGPVGLGLPVYVDHSAAALNSFVCGANVEEKHHTGVNWDRDAGHVEPVDIRNVVEGDQAVDGSGPLAFRRGIEVGHIFKLGTKYTESMDVTIQDDGGNDIMPIMGCYGFGVSRTVAAVVEQCHDENGIAWPDAVAPYAVHILALNAHRSADVATTATAVYERLLARGVEVLLDDRDERPGVKFADSDLIGIPHRLTIGDRGLKNGIVEYTHRRTGEKEDVELARLDEFLNERMSGSA